MPTLSQLQENSVPVVLTRWQFVLTCQVFVERLSPSNPVLAELDERRATLAKNRQSVADQYNIEAQALRLQKEALLNPKFLGEQLQQKATTVPKERKPKAEKEEANPFEIFALNAESIQGQLKEVDEKLEVLTSKSEKEVGLIDEQIFGLACEKIAYLLKAWDLVGEDGKGVETTAVSIQTVFIDKQEIIMGWVERTGKKTGEGKPEYQLKSGLLDLIEEAAFGPLETPSDSTS